MTAALLLATLLAGRLPAVDVLWQTITSGGRYATIQDPVLNMANCTVSGSTEVIGYSQVTVSPNTTITGSCLLATNEAPGNGGGGQGGNGAYLPPSRAVRYVDGLPLYLDLDYAAMVKPGDMFGGWDARSPNLPAPSYFYNQHGGAAFALGQFTTSTFFIPLYHTETGLQYGYLYYGPSAVDNVVYNSDYAPSFREVTMRNRWTFVPGRVPAGGGCSDLSDPLGLVSKRINSAKGGVLLEYELNLAKYPSYACPLFGQHGYIGETVTVLKQGKGTVVLVDQVPFDDYWWPVAIARKPNMADPNFVNKYYGSRQAYFSWMYLRSYNGGKDSNVYGQLPFAAPSVFVDGRVLPRSTVAIGQYEVMDCNQNLMRAQENRSGYKYSADRDPTYIDHAWLEACFVAGTKVLTKDGLKAIESITPGTMVRSMDVDGTGVFGWQPVLQTYAYPDRGDLFDVTVGGEVVRATGDHRFRVGQVWVPARSLTPGMSVVAAGASKPVPVQSVVPVAGTATVYNLSVKRWPVYTVGSKSLVVHNECKVKTTWRGNSGTVEISYYANQLSGSFFGGDKVKGGGSATIGFDLNEYGIPTNIAMKSYKVQADGSMTVSGSTAVKVQVDVSYAPKPSGFLDGLKGLVGIKLEDKKWGAHVGFDALYSPSTGFGVKMNNQVLWMSGNLSYQYGSSEPWSNEFYFTVPFGLSENRFDITTPVNQAALWAVDRLWPVRTDITSPTLLKGSTFFNGADPAFQGWLYSTGYGQYTNSSSFGLPMP